MTICILPADADADDDADADADDDDVVEQHPSKRLKVAKTMSGSGDWFICF